MNGSTVATNMGAKRSRHSSKPFIRHEDVGLLAFMV